MTAPAALFAEKIGLISGADLALQWGYAGPNNAFRDFCTKLRITHVPGRPGWYDPHLIRRRMDEAQGLLQAPSTGNQPLSLVEQRRARHGAV